MFRVNGLEFRARPSRSNSTAGERLTIVRKCTLARAADDLNKRRFVFGFKVQSSECRVQGSGFRVQSSGFRVQGSGFRVQGSGFRVQVAGTYSAALPDETCSARRTGLGRVSGFSREVSASVL